MDPNSASSQPIESQTPVPSPVPSPATVPQPAAAYAGFGQRLVASFIDGFIVWLAGFIIQVPFSLLSVFMNSDSSTGASGASLAVSLLSSVVSLFVWALSAAYYVYFIGKKGQTLGKQAMKIRVLKIETGAPPGYAGAFLRETIGKVLSGLVFGLGFLWMLWDEKKQTWHDKIAGTIVVQA